VLPHLINSVLASIAWRQNKRLHPSASGKVSTATGWISMLAFVAGLAFTDASEHTDMYYIVYGIALGLLLLTAVLSLVATMNYIHEFRRKIRISK
jgi:phosphatidylglycerophosphate synthase